LAGLTLAHAANYAISNLGNLIVARSLFYANSGEWGGAITTLPIGGATSVTIIDSTFAGNSADQGGAIYVSGSPLTITGSTFSGNSAANTNPLQGAGAIVHAGGGTATIGGTIIAHSIGGNCVGIAPPLADLGHNLTDAGGNCGLTGPTDLPNTDPRLDPAGL